MGRKDIRGRADIKGKQQYAALPIRSAINGGSDILLLTSRGTGRWIIPKGWPMKGFSPKQAAVREAYEEAGLEGEVVGELPVGRYGYDKGRASGTVIRIHVDVFVLRVFRQLATWPEQAERETRWFSPREAASLVAEPELAAIVRMFDTVPSVGEIAERDARAGGAGLIGNVPALPSQPERP